MAADIRTPIPHSRRRPHPVPRTAGPMRDRRHVGSRGAQVGSPRIFSPGGARNGRVPALPTSRVPARWLFPVSGTVPGRASFAPAPFRGGPHRTGLPSAPFVLAAARPAAETAMPTQIPASACVHRHLRPPQPPRSDPSPAGLVWRNSCPLEYFCSRGRAVAAPRAWVGSFRRWPVTAPRFYGPAVHRRVEPAPLAPPQKRKRPLSPRSSPFPEAAAGVPRCFAM